MKCFGLAAIMMLATISQAGAWDDEGHMIVAAAAYEQLTPQTKARVAQLLALNKYPSNGSNDASAAEKAKAVFIMAATAPDAIKRDTKHFKNEGE